MERIAFWIASDGDDENTGAEKMPLATTKEALARIRRELYQEAYIYYKDGKHFLEEPIELTASEHDIHFCAADGEKPEICGGYPISGWTEENVNGIQMWVADIPEDRRKFQSLFSSTSVLPRSRWPKKGYFLVDHALDEDGYGHTDPNVKMQYAMYVNQENLLDFKNKRDVTVKIFHWWKDETVNIREIEPDTGRVTFTRPATMTIKAGDRYYFENVWETMWEPGEWYIDQSMGRLYYIPFPGERIDHVRLYAAQTEQFVECDGARNISFEGLHFTMGDWSIPQHTVNACGADHHQAAYDVTPAFYFTNTKGIAIHNCEFSKIMSNCLKFGVNVQNITVMDNTFRDIGANGIFIVGENREKNHPCVTRKFLVSNNRIVNYGQRFFNGTAIGILHAAEGEISNNEIHDGYYTAITLGWVWGYGYSVTSDILVKQNHIYNIGLNLLSDMGAIYTLGVKEHIVITENVIHDVKANLQYGYGGWGIYMDEGSSNVMITKNLVYNCNSTAFYQHYGRDNLVINNILAFCEQGQVSSYRNQPHVGFHLIRNIIVSEGSPFISMEDIVKKKIRGRFNAANNIYWDYETKNQGIDVEWFTRELGLFTTANFKNPKFEDWKKRDFRIKSNSPVFELGFVSWDISQAGVKKSDKE